MSSTVVLIMCVDTKSYTNIVAFSTFFCTGRGFNIGARDLMNNLLRIHYLKYNGNSSNILELFISFQITVVTVTLMV